MPGQSGEWLRSLESDGFAILDRVLAADRVAQLIAASEEWSVAGREGVLDRRGETYGVRDLLWRSPEVRLLAGSPELMELVEPVLGGGAFAVRGLYFDKTPAANWNLPWHQDLTIAVRSRCEVAGFGPWTLKARIPHAHAPADLLARMLTVRIHLDDCGLESGPMRVLRGSHAAGKLSPSQVAGWSARAGEIGHDCLVPAGGAVVMRPLILHASASATGPGHRRVIHLEYAAESLPDGLAWYGPGT
jgi:hypothetical protein